MFQCDNAPVHKVRSIQKLFVEIGVEELDCPAQRSDLKPIEVPSVMFQHLVESLPRRVEAVTAAKGGTSSILMPMILE